MDEPKINLGGTIIVGTATETRSVFDPTPAGAFVKVLRTEREMTTYAFTDGELSTIGMFSGILNVAFAGAFAVVGAILGTWTDASMSRMLIYLALLIGSGALGFWAARKRSSEIERVKRESKTVTI